MVEHVFLIDVTRHKGPMQQVIQSARAHAESFLNAKVIWLQTQYQAPAKTEGEELIISTPEALMDTVIGTIEEMAANGAAGATFHVLSYDGATLRQAFAQNALGRKVNTQSFGYIRRLQNKSSEELSTKSESMPLPEAAALTRTLLKQLGHTSEDRPLPQNRLRILLTRLDQRARKDVRVYKSTTLISDLVELGTTEGWLGTGTVSGKSGTEYIWLKEQLAVPAGATDTRSEAARRAEEKTEKIIRHLKDKGLYAPKDIRDLILSQLLLIAPLGITVVKLFRKASEMAQARAKAEDLSFDYWRPATDSTTNIALQAGVFLDPSGRVIVDSFTSRGSLVEKVDADLINMCDRHLMVATIAGVPNLTPRDAPAIAHALFKESPKKITQDDMIDRVHEVLSQLTGKLDQDTTGVLTVI